MSSIIIFDFEVFKHDTLLGTKIIDSNGGEPITFQTWDFEDIRNFYELYKSAIWVGHNNQAYDNLILETIIKHNNPYLKSKELINSKFKPHCGLKNFYYWDLMCQRLTPYSLKATELADGENISETEVSFDLDRKLTDDEKALTESYNRDDLNRTEKNFKLLISEFSLRLEMLKEFNLPLTLLNITGQQLAAIVLEAHKIDGIENMRIPAKLPPNLQLKNQDLLNYYLKEDFRDPSKSVQLTIAGCEHNIAHGGIHAGLPHYHTDKALYFDVSGYYNLTMMNYDLLPRTMSEKGKELYHYMYKEQLRLKKINPVKRTVYKKTLLSVFGAMNYAGSQFYDPQKCSLVTIVGMMFLFDLLEKLEPYIKIVQSNTDGIIVEPWNYVTNTCDWSLKDKIVGIVCDWENRTGYTIKKDEITDIYQRDVNCYFYKMNGEIHTVGEAVKQYNAWENIFEKDTFGVKEPAIYAQCIVEYFMFNKKPEQVIEENKRHLKAFQYIARKTSYDYTFIQINHYNGDVETRRLQGVNRVFPTKDKDFGGTIYKYAENKKVKQAKVACIPDVSFVYDNEILSDKAIDFILSKINLDYYIDRAYEKISAFNFKTIKSIDLSKYDD